MVAGGLTRKSINSLVTRIRQMFRWAAEQELLPVTIHQSLCAVAGLKKGRTAASEKPPVVRLTLRWWKRLCLTSPDCSRDGPAPMANGHEAGRSHPDEVGRSEHGWSIWEYKPGSHKTEHHERDRTIFFGPQAQEVLKPWLQLDLHASLFSPERSETERAAVRRSNRKTKLWPSHAAHQARKEKNPLTAILGDHYSVASYRRAIARACDLAFPHPSLAKIPEQDLNPEQRSELKTWRKDIAGTRINCVIPSRPASDESSASKRPKLFSGTVSWGPPRSMPRRTSKRLGK